VSQNTFVDKFVELTKFVLITVTIHEIVISLFMK